MTGMNACDSLSCMSRNVLGLAVTLCFLCSCLDGRQRILVVRVVADAVALQK